MKMQLIIDGRKQAPLPTKGELSETIAKAIKAQAETLVLSCVVNADESNVQGGQGVHGGADGRFARIEATLGELFPVSLRQDKNGQTWLDVEIPAATLEAADASPDTLEFLLIQAAVIDGRWIGAGSKRMNAWFNPEGEPVTFAQVAESVGIAAHKREAVSRAALAAGFTTEARFNWAQVGSQSATKTALAMLRWNQAWANRPTDRSEYGIDEALADLDFGRPMLAKHINALRRAGVMPSKGKLVAYCQEFDGEA